MKSLSLKIKILFTLLFVFNVSGCVEQNAGSQYFQPVSQMDAQNPFFEAGENKKDCSQIIKDDLLPASAFAYDFGLCVKQDLRKAKDLYERAIQEELVIPQISLRLGLIYKFGPYDLRNEERYTFLMKQTAISLAMLNDEEKQQTLLQNTLNGGPVPRALTKSIDWYNDLIQKTDPEKREQYLLLKSEGFVHLYNLWDEEKELMLRHEKFMKQYGE